jgi:hypothetical protein
VQAIEASGNQTSPRASSRRCHNAGPLRGCGRPEGRGHSQDGAPNGLSPPSAVAFCERFGAPAGSGRTRRACRGFVQGLAPVSR